VEHSKKHILVVDDLKSNRLYIREFFERRKFTVYTAEHGKEALDILERYEVDIILLDVEMPVLGGYDTCRIIKEDHRWKNIPIIFITSKNDEESTIKGFEVGAHDFVVKPFNDGELYARVKTHLELKAKSEQLIMLNKYLEEIVEQRTFQLREAMSNLEKAYHEIEHSHKQLQTLSVAKMNFLKIISHEIRTPLNGVVGFVDVLQDTVKTEELKTYVNYLAKSAARLEQFATDAIFITELTVDSYEISEYEFLLQDLVEEIESSVEELVVQNDVRLVFKPVGSPILYTDRNLFGIALRHIIENAVKYSPNSGTVTIESVEDGGYVVQVIVIDEGAGFSSRALESLFDLFALGQEHLDNTSGLGLALANLIMQKLKGQILVKNNSDQGASVTLYL